MNARDELQGTLSASEFVEAPVADFEAFLTVGARSVPICFEVYGSWIWGFPGTRETPAEPKYLDVRKVTANGRDVTNLLSDELFAEWFYTEVYGR